MVERPVVKPKRTTRPEKAEAASPASKNLSGGIKAVNNSSELSKKATSLKTVRRSIKTKLARKIALAQEGPKFVMRCGYRPGGNIVCPPKSILKTPVQGSSNSGEKVRKASFADPKTFLYIHIDAGRVRHFFLEFAGHKLRIGPDGYIPQHTSIADYTIKGNQKNVF